MKRISPFFLIAIVCIAAFWQVVFFKGALKYDILDGYLPGHYFMSECLRNAIFPLWNPYHQLGVPVYADLLSTNYLVDIIIGRLFPYTNITYHVFFIIYVIVAGVGAYKLSAQLKISEKICLLIGIAYSLSGFITGNAQHIQFIISAAWLPFSLVYFLKLFQEGRTGNMLLFVLFTGLLITGGYPSLAIVLAYLLGGLFIYKLIDFLRQGTYRLAFLLWRNCSIAAVLLIMLCSGMFIGIWQSTPHVERFTGLTYDYAITNPFTPSSLVSLVAPLVPASHPALFGTDVSMNNLYVGVIMLVLFIYGLFKPFNVKSTLILIAGLLLLFISFGDHFFIHRVFYEYVPLFNKFRHPSAIRVFSILFFLLFAGIQVSRFDPAKNEHFRLFRKVYTIMILALLVVGLISFGIVLKKVLGPVDFKPTIASLCSDYGISGPLFFQIAVVLMLNVIFIYSIFIRKKFTCFYPVILIILIGEAIIFTQMNQYYTVIYKHNPLEIRSFLRNRPMGFPLPDQHVLLENTDESVASIPLIHNTNIYAKTVSPYASKYPFSLDGFQELEQDSLLFAHVTKNSLLYFGDTLVPLSRRDEMNNHLICPEKNYVFVDDSIAQDIRNDIHMSSSVTDSIECIDFSPVRMSFITRSDSARLAVLQQNNYPGWNVYVNGEETAHFTVNRSLIGIVLPPGEHLVTYEYTNSAYKTATLFSFSLFFLLVLVILILYMANVEKNAQNYLYTGLGIVFLVMLPAILILKPATPFSKILEENNGKIMAALDTILFNEREEDVFMLFNTESPHPFDEKYKGRNVTYQRFRFATDANWLWHMLDTLKTDKLLYIWSNVLEIPEMRDIMHMHFPVLVKQYAGKRYTILEFSKDTTGHGIRDHHFLHDFEKPYPNWSIEQVNYDTLVVHSGQRAEKLSGNREFGSTFRYTLEHIPAGGIKVFASCWFLQKGNEPCHLAISVNRKGKTVQYHAVDLTRFRTHKTGWNIGFASQQWVKSSLKRGDEIIIYCWNSGKNEAVYVDDFLVRVGCKTW